MMTNRHFKNDQRGMVAIVTTLILMIVISLIVVGFSQVARRNQRQALDAQLASQAFYAAESGINVAKSKLHDNPYYTKNDCSPDTTTTGADYAINASDQTAITCLEIKPVNNLIFDDIGSTSKVALIKPTPTAAVGSLYINWENKDDTSVTNCNVVSPPIQLPKVSNWTCSQPILRVDLVPIDGTLTQATLQSSQYSVFLYPVSNGGTTTVHWGDNSGSGNRGGIATVSCNDSADPSNKVYKCTAVIDTLGASSYGMRMMSLYRNAKVELHTAGKPQLVGAQVLVDSTAKARDVLKRVQARVSMANNTVVPDFAVMSDELCKRYLVSGTTADVENTTEAAACRLP